MTRTALNFMLVLSMAYLISAPGTARADGLVDQLDTLITQAADREARYSKAIEDLQRQINQLQRSRPELIAHGYCAAANKNWDYGQAHLLERGLTCNDLCKSKESGVGCTGAVAVNIALQSAQYACNVRRDEYIGDAYCCCR